MRQKSLVSFISDKKNLLQLDTLDIELTERCNYNCIHCCINQPQNNQQLINKELSCDQISNILMEAAALNVKTIRLTGGEPLLRADFKEIYRLCRKLGMDVLFFTNASLLTPELVQLFASVPPNRKIEITCYGMSQKSYESVTRSPGSFNRFNSGIDLLLKNDVPFVIKGALLPPNIHEVSLFDKWTKANPWMKEKTSFSMFFDLRIRQDSAEKNYSIRKMRISPAQGLSIISRNEPGFSDGMKIYCSQFMYPQGDDLFTCGAGKSSISLDAYGFLHPCLLIKSPDNCYDLKSGSLKEALTDFFPSVRKIKAKNPDYLNRCANCFLKGLCEICPGKSWAEHGTFDTPVDYCCKIAHAQAIYLGYLQKGEKGWEVKERQKRMHQAGK